jgi:arsenate reductase
MSKFPVTVFHNPACGTSRNVVAAVREAGYEPTVVEYLKAGWTKAQLKDLLKTMGAKPRDILRDKGTPAEELGLTDPAASDEKILDAMVANPILVNRPIVVTPKGAALCRPSEEVFTLLENAPETFTKEDGEKVIPRR